MLNCHLESYARALSGGCMFSIYVTTFSVLVAACMFSICYNFYCLVAVLLNVILQCLSCVDVAMDLVLRLFS